MKKGFTLVEMLVTFVILSIIVVIMTNILFKVKETSEKTSELTKVAMFQSNVTRLILKDLNTDTLDSLVSCGENCYTLTYDSLGIKELSVAGNTITYGDYVKEVPTGGYLKGNISIENDYVSSVVGSNNSILSIEIPVGNYYNANEYNINVDFQYDSAEVYIENITSFNSYQYQRKLTIDHTKIDSDLTNFPVAVVFDNANFDFSKLTDSINGYDLKFLDFNDNELDFERELYDSTNQKAVYHVRIPSVSSSIDTYFYVQYNKEGETNQANGEAVWDDSYVLVHHMGDNLLDSTSNNNDGTPIGTTTVVDFLGKNREFNGTSDYIDCGSDPTLSMGTSSFSVSVVFKNRNVRADMSQKLASNGGIGSGGKRYELQLDDVTNQFHSEIDDNSYNSNIYHTGTVSLTEFNYGAFIRNRTTDQLITVLNGVKETAADDTDGAIDGSRPFRIGVATQEISGELQRFYDGYITEVRVSNIARSDAWVKAEYHSLLNTLLTYGIEENV